MMDIEWADYWWNRITGPQGVVEAVADSLSDGHSVSLRIPGDLPWRHEMRAAIRDSLQASYGLADVSFEILDGDELPSPLGDPGLYLLKRFALKTDQRLYRPHPGKTVQSFLIERKALRNRIVWLKGLQKDEGEAWLTFCSHYHSSSVEDGLFIIETNDDRNGSGGSGVRTIALADHVSVFDAQLLNSIMVSDEMPKTPDSVKRYYTALATHLCGTDVEVSGVLITQPDYIGSDPIGLIGRIAQMEEFSRRGSQSCSHVLGLFRGGNLEGIKHRIWEAQIETLFPLIESERLSIIEDLEEDIWDLVNSSGIEQFGEQVVNPNDVELGTLSYLMATRKLYVPNAAMRDRIRLLRDCRNTIAHRDCCSTEQVALLLDA